MRARTRDRRVYLAGHPFLFTLLAATRHRPTLRLGRTVLVHDREAFTAALTRLPLDRTATGTTGGAITALKSGNALFDQRGPAHRDARRATAAPLTTANVTALRPLWTALMTEALLPLRTGATVDLVPVAAEIAGATALALISPAQHHTGAEARTLAEAAQAAAAATTRAHLPGPFRRRTLSERARRTAAHLTSLIAPDAALHAILAVAAINTTVAALPRAAAWAADDNLWYADPSVLADELLRVTAPTPLLPRAAAAGGHLPPRCPVRPGDRLILMARHAADAHRTDPDPAAPAPPHIAQLVFGVGPHACPGARLARVQMTDWLTALAPYRPAVTRARANRNSALPSWRSLRVRATRAPPTDGDRGTEAAW